MINLFKGDITITEDTNLALNLSYNPSFRVLALMDDAKSVFGEANVYAVPILLPPYVANEAENLGDLQSFWNLYWQHLSTPDAESYFSLIMTGLYKGFNILLYVNPDEDSLSFVNAFLKFVQDYYGLTIGTKDSPCGFDLRYEDIIRLKMFKFGYIPVMDVVTNIHNKITDPYICSIIVNELNLQAEPDVVSQVDQYINTYRAQLIQQQQPKKLIPPPWRIVI